METHDATDWGSKIKGGKLTPAALDTTCDDDVMGCRLTTARVTTDANGCDYFYDRDNT